MHTPSYTHAHLRACGFDSVVRAEPRKKSDRPGGRAGAGLPRINTHVCLDPLLKAHRLVKPSLYVYAHRGIRVCTCMASPLIPSVQLSSLYSRLYLCVCRTHGILGHVYRPYSYQYTSDSRLTDAVNHSTQGYGMRKLSRTIGKASTNKGTTRVDHAN